MGVFHAVAYIALTLCPSSELLAGTLEQTYIARRLFEPGIDVFCTRPLGRARRGQRTGSGERGFESSSQPGLLGSETANRCCLLRQQGSYRQIPTVHLTRRAIRDSADRTIRHPNVLNTMNP
jgi:hypothetical protein